METGFREAGETFPLVEWEVVQRYWTEPLAPDDDPGRLTAARINGWCDGLDRQ